MGTINNKAKYQNLWNFQIPSRGSKNPLRFTCLQTNGIVPQVVVVRNSSVGEMWFSKPDTSVKPLLYMLFLN